jgi:16S rRNA (adenine1518-N6/adenine1519-N6)-dimethyltransferase
MNVVAGRKPSGYETDERSDGPVQPSLRRMRRFGVRPDRDLGQNFLIDSNILGVIVRAAELSPEDVVLEVGGGLGVLSEYLAERAAHVHVVEIDERLREALCDATDPHANVTVHWADAMTLDLTALRPAPDKVVANLPYGVAASVLLRSIEELPSVRLWVAMVQREVGERLAASSGSGAYGVPSVLAQLACDVQVVRPIPRAVFHPVPNVDSVLVTMRRRADAGEPVSPAVRSLVAGAFAHRRKTLAGSLGLARGGSGSSGPLPRRSREQLREALVHLGHPADARAERLSPEDFRALARLLEL